MSELLVEGPHPVVGRRALEEAVAVDDEWVVITARPGDRPPGQVPARGILVSTAPVTEAIKHTDGGRVVASLDRGDLVEAVVPVVMARSTLAGILANSSEDPLDVVVEVANRGGPVMTAL